MTKELENLLATYLGELLHRKENCYDWIEREAIIRKINAIYTLLDIKGHEKTFVDGVEKLFIDVCRESKIK